MFPGIAFLVLSAFCTGILNSHRHFFLSYVSPVMWNATQIAFVVAAGVWGATEVGIAHALAWGVLVGAVARGRHPGAVRASPDPRRPAWLDIRSPDVQDVLSRFIPVVIGRGVIQLLIYVDLFLASLLAVGGVSALTYGQVLYLLPISLFGMAVAAAELPELARLGRDGARRDQGAPAHRDGADHVLRRHHRGALRVRRRRHRGRCSCSEASSPPPTPSSCGTWSPSSRSGSSARRARGCSRTGSTPSTARSWSPASPSSASPSRGLLGALFMFPLDRFAIVDGSVTQIGSIALRPLPDSVRLVEGGPPRLGVVGLALGAAAVVVGRVPAPQGGARVADRRPARGWASPPPGASSPPAAAASSPPACGPSPRTSPRSSPAAVVCLPTILMYLVITTVMGVPEATHLVGRLRRVLAGGRGAQR